MSPFSQQIP